MKILKKLKAPDIADYTNTGVDLLSTGALTYSAKQMDVSLRIIEVKEESKKFIKNLKYKI